MPISFETASPIQAVVNANRSQGAGGGGGGIPLSEMYAMEMGAKQAAMLQNAGLQQRDRQFQDDLRERRTEMDNSRNFSARDAGMAQAAMAQANQRAQLASQLQQEDMSNTEYMRLQRLRQAEDAVKQAGTNGELLPQEVEQHLLQLRTGINPLLQKKAATEMKHMELQNKAIENQMEVARQGELRKLKDSEDHLAYSAAAVGGKLKYVPDQQAVSEFSQKIKDEFPEMPPERVQALAQQEAIKQGRYFTFYPNEKGVPQHAKELDAARMTQMGMSGATAAGGHKESGSGTGSGTHGGRAGAGEFDPAKAYESAERSVRDRMKNGEQIADVPGEIAKGIAERRKVVEGYANEKRDAEAATKPAPFDPHKAGEGTDKQRAVIEAAKSAFERMVTPEVQRGIPLAQQTEINAAKNRILSLTGKYLDAGGKQHFPGYVKDEIESLEKKIKTIAGKSAGGGKPMSEEERYRALEEMGRKWADGNESRAQAAAQTGTVAGEAAKGWAGAQPPQPTGTKTEDGRVIQTPAQALGSYKPSDALNDLMGALFGESAPWNKK